MPEKKRIIIEVSGGLVSNITADDDVSVYLIDHDNLKDRSEEDSARNLAEARQSQSPDRIVRSDEEFKLALNQVLNEYESDRPADVAPGR